LIGFAERIRTAQESARSALVIELAPSMEQMPYPLLRHDEPFLPFGKALIDVTADLVCGYLFNLAAYLSLGASGVVALERTMAYTPANRLKVVHGPFAGIDFARLLSPSAFDADAVTLLVLTPEQLQPFLNDAAKGAWLELPEGGALPEKFQPICEQHWGQVAMYSTGAEPRRVAFPNSMVPVVHWAASSVTGNARGENFKDAIRAAALEWRGIL
jgi:hypothetical protein